MIFWDSLLLAISVEMRYLWFSHSKKLWKCIRRHSQKMCVLHHYRMSQSCCCCGPFKCALSRKSPKLSQESIARKNRLGRRSLNSAHNDGRIRRKGGLKEWRSDKDNRLAEGVGVVGGIAYAATSPALSQSCSQPLPCNVGDSAIFEWNN